MDIKRFAIKFPLLAFVTFLSCGTVQVYKEPDKPILYFTDKKAITEPSDSLSVVTFNIKEAEKMELAAAELKEFQTTRSIDIYLLQEMDEKGVEAIAKEFNLNYLYFPIVHNKVIQKNIGNAILTKGLIRHPQKLILPHAQWLNHRLRHVTIGEVEIHQKKILVYSVHTETVLMSRKKRMEQVDAIIKHAKLQLPNYQYFLIGGDFNTVFSKDAQQVVEKFKANAFDWSTATAGSTAKAFYGLIKPIHDCVFSKGLNPVSAGKIETSKSSDHYPVFATFRY